MTKLIADVKTRFALTKRLRLRGVIFVNSIDFLNSPHLGRFFYVQNSSAVNFGDSHHCYREEDHGELALPEAHHLYSRAFS